MASAIHSRMKWRRVLERWLVRDNKLTDIKAVSKLPKGERLFRAPSGVHVIVHAASTTIYGEYLIDTEGHLIIGLIREGRSSAFVEWERIELIEVH